MKIPMQRTQSLRKVFLKWKTSKNAVDSMKGLTKEELTKLFSSLSEEEVDESLTKAEVARNIVEGFESIFQRRRSEVR